MSITIIMRQIFNKYKFWDIKIKESYNLISKSPIYIDKLRIVVDELRNISGSILDIGIGYGLIEKLIEQNNLKLRLYGIDISKFAISNADKLYTGEFIKSGIKYIPFDSDKFNVVLALDILEHLRTKECLRGLKEIYRVMKMSGKFIVSIPINENKIDTFENHHLQKYDLTSITNQLNLSGFRVTNKYYLTAYKSNYKIRNLINRFLRISKPNLLILICKKK